MDSPNLYHVGDVVPYHYKGWIVFLSVLVSLIGSETTVELLHRRRHGRGLISQLHLCLCAVSFGLVAIWCMHFVGNKAIIMGDGREAIQLTYRPGLTALSAILPIVGLYLGFSVVDFFGKTKRFLYLSLVATGLTAGLSVMGMHYIGNQATANYKVENNYKHVIGAAAIAVFDCWFAFTIFFHQREQWINYWWRRTLCAVLLAGAVSGMHWVAALGTSYRLKVLDRGDTLSHNINIIIAAVLCMVALIGCMALLYLTNLHQKRLAKRAHEVVLSAVIRDEHGRMLVTQEGLPPSRTITSEFYQYNFGETLDKDHPVFHWIYRISYNWGAISELVPKLKDYLNGVRFSSSRPSGDGSDPSEPRMDWLIFRAQCCVAARDLATDLGWRLQDIGTLHPELMITGVGCDATRTTSMEDIESIKAASAVGKGQTMFVSRDVNQQEALRLVTLGYRFASLTTTTGKPNRVLDIMATKMQVERHALLSIFRNTMPTPSISIPVRLNPTLDANQHYLSLFALRPSLKSSHCRWEVLVYKHDLTMIPHVSPGFGPALDVHSALKTFEGKTTSEICNILDGTQKRHDSQTDIEFRLVDWITDSVYTFRKLVPPRIFQSALFSATPVTVPVPGAVPGSQSYTTVWPFTVVADIHSCFTDDQDDVWTWVPLNFFQNLQTASRTSPYSSPFAHKSYIDFSTLLVKAKGITSIDSTRRNVLKSTLSKVHERTKTATSLGRVQTHADNVSEKELVRMEVDDFDSDMTPSGRSPFSFGGILISQDVVQSDVEFGANIELGDMGLTSTVGVATDDEPTWVDDMYSALVQKWLKRPGSSREAPSGM